MIKKLSVIVVFIIIFAFSYIQINAEGLVWQASNIVPVTTSAWGYLIQDYTGDLIDGKISDVGVVVGHNYQWRIKNVSGSGSWFFPVYYGEYAGTWIDYYTPYFASNSFSGDISFNFTATYPHVFLLGQVNNCVSTCTISAAELWDMDASPTATPSATPTPTPTSTATPTPTPSPTLTPTPTPTPLPVNKVVFIPGFGGSWNTNAFLNCSFDPNPDNWSLAPYAADVYNPILTALNSTGWNTKPFYYDWRAQVPNNSNVLGNVINNFATTPEKVNIVGHSMGGLVGANYLSNDQGTKTNSLLTIGSPFKGVPIAYPAWSAGDIWQDNFIGKIAVNLYLKRCGKLNPTKEIVRSQFPAIQNLLPIFDYLKNGNILKPWSTMFAKNNWLPLVFDNNFWGVKFETLTGSGFDTLSQIPVKSASPKDIKDGNYLDGKPNGKITTLNGDGTVLLTSAKIDDIHNVTITQNHQGLVNSIDGMTEILKFLGSSTSAPLLTSSEINSSLIIIADSNNFWVTDSNGNTKKDKGGIIAFNNPKSGNYKFTLLPNNFDSIVIVAQLLPNGEFLYKEYNFKNFLPKFKTFEIVN